MNRFRKLLLVAILLSLAPSSARAQDAVKPKMPEHLAEILNWLPDNAETLVVARGPFELPCEPAAESNDIPPFLDSARLLTVGLVTGLQDGLLAKPLQGRKVVIAVEASRRFTSPKGLGMMPFEGCQIVKFDAAARDAVHEAVVRCIEKAPKTVQLGDTKVGVFTQKWEDDEWTVFVAEPSPGVLICATNQKFLEQMFERMGRKKHEDRAFPNSLPEWEYADLKAPMWGMRHYRKEFSATDPSSPLRPKAAANVPDPHAIGFVFRLDARTARAYYLSGAKDAVKIACEGWNQPNEHLTPTLKEIKPGVVEIVESVAKEEKRGEHMFLFMLLAYLGHAVYL